MPQTFAGRLSLLSGTDELTLLLQGGRGIEREALRVDAQGELALTPHPAALGSALTHPTITTDYAEALLELITRPATDCSQALAELEELHWFVHSRLEGEYLWNLSMPGRLPVDEQIPIAWYGPSNPGMLRHVYRRGLALRYGKRMQCIAGIHYNYSLPPELFAVLTKAEVGSPKLLERQSAAYMRQIRNLRQYGWLLAYLFGASPAICTGFLGVERDELARMGGDTLYMPYATSLRMSDIGYRNRAMDDLSPSLNDLGAYIRDIYRALHTPDAQYQALGVFAQGEWRQLNANLLQLDSEYYALARPKSAPERGERNLDALARRGVQYVELRALDLDPFSPLGIGLTCAKFLDGFLLFCLLSEAPVDDRNAQRQDRENLSLAGKYGRQPGLKLHRNGQSILLKDWALEVLAEVQVCIELLDSAHGGSSHALAWSAQEEKVLNPDCAPSAQVLAEIHRHGGSFTAFGRQLGMDHAKHFSASSLEAGVAKALDHQATLSLREQHQLEANDRAPFSDYLQQFSPAFGQSFGASQAPNPTAHLTDLTPPV